MISRIGNILLKPAFMYNRALETHPLTTKCITSGIMYAGGDMIAQSGENYNGNKELKEEEKLPFHVDRNRLTVFFIFGTFLGGPAYHYWFNYLNELPEAIWRFKNMRKRSKILQAYAYLKNCGIEVKLDTAMLPKAKHLSKWGSKGVKILADQLIFSSIYTIVFFMAVGIMNGAADRYSQIKVMENNANNEANSKSSKDLQPPPPGGSSSDAAHHTATTTTSSHPHPSVHLPNVHPPLHHHHHHHHHYEHVAAHVIEYPAEIIVKHGHNEKVVQMTWQGIVDAAWAHAREVYVTTYMTDCIVWPPIQLINFTFVPLKFQVLYVNVANLGWNTFLSFMANKKHD